MFGSELAQAIDYHGGALNVSLTKADCTLEASAGPALKTWTW